MGHCEHREIIDREKLRSMGGHQGRISLRGCCIEEQYHLLWIMKIAKNRKRNARDETGLTMSCFYEYNNGLL